MHIFVHLMLFTAHFRYEKTIINLWQYGVALKYGQKNVTVWYTMIIIIKYKNETNDRQVTYRCYKIEFRIQNEK